MDSRAALVASRVGAGEGGGPPPRRGFRGTAENAKTKLCTRFTSPEGCRFGDRCNFAHGESELRKLPKKVAVAGVPIGAAAPGAVPLQAPTSQEAVVAPAPAPLPGQGGVGRPPLAYGAVVAGSHRTVATPQPPQLGPGQAVPWSDAPSAGAPHLGTSSAVRGPAPAADGFAPT